VIGVTLKNLPQELTVHLIIGCLEAAQKLVESFKGLARKLGGDQVLVLAAIFQDRRKPLVFRHAIQAIGTQQHDERGENRPPRHLEHFRKLKGHVPAGLTLGCIHEADFAPVHQQSCWDSRFPQQPLEARLWSGLPPMRVNLCNGVKLRFFGYDVDQQNPLVLGVLG